jgi:biopolymer transport protein ExbB
VKRLFALLLCMFSLPVLAEPATLSELQAQSRLLAQAIDSAEQRLAERKKRLGAWQALPRLLAEDSSKLLGGSLIGLQVPEQAIDLQALRQTPPPPLLPSLEQMAQRLLREMRGQAEVARFESLLVAVDGRQRQAEITRVGPFVALHQGQYLEYVPELARLRLLERQPAGRFLQANGQSLNGLTTYAIDPARGALLALLVQTPELQERLHQGGLVGYLILLLAAVGLLLALVRILLLQGVARRVAWQKRHGDQPRDNNPLGRVLLAVADQTERDIELIERRLDEAILKEMPRLERGLGLIRLLAAIAPLLGLLGTVVGMILTFQAISLFGSGDPKLMAGGISQALVTTVMGLCAAIPLLLLHSLAAGSSRRVEQVLEEQAAALVARRLEQGRG